jgi:hypothetical protein
MKAQPLKADPEGSPGDIPTANQNTEPLSPSRENVVPKGTFRDMAAAAQAKESYLAWFDGACEPFNPAGTATFGAIIKDKDGTVLSKQHGLVGRGKAMSNNVAEYAGVLRILKHLATLPARRVTIHGDSNLVINQLNGKWRIKKGLYLSIAIETKELLDSGKLITPACWPSPVLSAGFVQCITRQFTTDLAKGLPYSPF